MRTPFIAGNWKMNLDRESAVELASAVRRFVEGQPAAGPEVDVALFPPFVYLADVVGSVRGSAVRVGAQNVHDAEKGAFTGEVSAPMVKGLGASMAILGHSERRHVFGEGDGWVARKLRAALKAGLDPILCVGEKLEEREAGKTFEVVERQFRAPLEGLSDSELRRITVAYEPVWAIGTGRNASPAQAGEAHGRLRACAAKAFGKAWASELRIQYGGSVTPENAGDLLAEPEVDGFLVGGASLDAGKFQKILEAGCRRSAAARAKV